MKYLILLAVVLAVFWYLRSLRRGRSQPDGRPGNATATPQDMVECPICSLHLPRADALPGPDGQLYCCAEHRSRAGSAR